MYLLLSDTTTDEDIHINDALVEDGLALFEARSIEEHHAPSKVIPNAKKSTTLSHKVVCFQMLDFKTSKSNSEVSKPNSWKISSFLKTTLITSEGAVSHDVLYYQQLPVTHYQVRK